MAANLQQNLTRQPRSHSKQGSRTEPDLAERAEGLNGISVSRSYNRISSIVVRGSMLSMPTQYYRIRDVVHWISVMPSMSKFYMQIMRSQAFIAMSCSFNDCSLRNC